MSVCGLGFSQSVSVSVHEYVCVCLCSLPERIRPTVLAFGGVADGFVPFDAQTQDGKQELSQEVQLQMASIVMKAVQVHLLLLVLLHVPMLDIL
jgi:hypothetical protein